MNMRKAIKKVLALSAGATMVGATLFGAMATGLSDYPSPFVKSGVYDAVIVVGNSAAAEDIVGAIDMAASLQYAMRQTTTVSTGVTVAGVEGGQAVETSAKHLHFSTENLLDLKGSFTSTEFPDLLGSATFDDDDGNTITMKQTLFLPNVSIKWGKSTPNTDNPLLYADLITGSPYYYTYLTFSPALNASKLITGQPVINIAGKPYTASGVSAEMSSTKLTLYGGGIDKTVTAGEKVTVTIDSADVEVSVAGVNTQTATATAMITIGTESKSVSAGHTYTVGGHRVYIKDVFAYTTPVASGAVRMFLGTDKLIFENGQQVAKGASSTYISGTSCVVSSTSGKISAIAINVTPTDLSPTTEWIGLNASMTDPVFESFKFSFTDVVPALESSERDYIEIYPSSDTKVHLKFTNKDDSDYSLNFLEHLDGRADEGNFSLMYDGKNITTTAATEILKNTYFILDKAGYSHILKLSTITNTSSTQEITLNDIGSGTTDKFSFAIAGADRYTGTIRYNGNEYAFHLHDKGSSSTSNWIMNFSSGAGLSTALYTKNGATITLYGKKYWTDTAFTGIPRVIVTEETTYNSEGTPDDYGTINVTFNYTSGASGMDTTVNSPTYGAIGGTLTGSFSGFVQLGSTYDQEAITPYGTFLQYNTDSDKVRMYYYGSETYYKFYVAPTGGATVSTGTGSVATTSIEKINVGAAKLASEISDPKAQNVISVGGPCVNAVSATLMGLTAGTCGAESTIPENKAIIKLFTNGNYEGLVVAGWNAADTQRATRVLADYASYAADLVGSEVVVTGTTMADISVSKPAEEIPAEETPATE